MCASMIVPSLSSPARRKIDLRCAQVGGVLDIDGSRARMTAA